MELATGFKIYLPDRTHFDALINAGIERIPDPGRSVFLDSVATAQHSAGMHHLARSTFEQAIASALAQFGEDHPSVATSRSNLAMVLKDLGDLEGAKKLLEQALASDLAQFGE